MLRLAIHWQILIGMIAGAVIGVALNIGASQRTISVREGLPVGIAELVIGESSGRSEIRLVKADGSMDIRIIDPGDRGANVYRSLAALREANSTAADLYSQHGGSLATVAGR